MKEVTVSQTKSLDKPQPKCYWKEYRLKLEQAILSDSGEIKTQFEEVLKTIKNHVDSNKFGIKLINGIFISHAWPEKKFKGFFTEKIYQREEWIDIFLSNFKLHLEVLGFKVYLDLDNTVAKPGESLYSNMEEKIKESDITLLIGTQTLKLKHNSPTSRPYSIKTEIGTIRNKLQELDRKNENDNPSIIGICLSGKSNKSFPIDLGDGFCNNLIWNDGNKSYYHCFKELIVRLLQINPSQINTYNSLWKTFENNEAHISIINGLTKEVTKERFDEDLKNKAAKNEKIHLNSVDLLKQKPSDNNNTGGKSYTNKQLNELLDAIREDNIDAINVLLQHIDVNAKESNNNMTPLYHAAAHGSEEVVKLLLATGADPELRVNGETPSEGAMANKRPDNAKLIEQAKSKFEGRPHLFTNNESETHVHPKELENSHTKLDEFFKTALNILKQIQNAKNEYVTFVVGEKGAGKSTLISSLLGCKLTEKTENYEKVLYIDESSKIKGKSYPKIENVNSVGTTETQCYDTENGLTFCDSPGFPNSTALGDIISYSTFELAIKSAKNIMSFIIVIDYSSLQVVRGKSFTEFSLVIDQLLEYVIQNRSTSLLFVFRNIKREEIPEIKDLKECFKYKIEATNKRLKDKLDEETKRELRAALNIYNVIIESNNIFMVKNLTELNSNQIINWITKEREKKESIPNNKLNLKLYDSPRKELCKLCCSVAHEGSQVLASIMKLHQEKKEYDKKQLDLIKEIGNSRSKIQGWKTFQELLSNYDITINTNIDEILKNLKQIENELLKIKTLNDKTREIEKIILEVETKLKEKEAFLQKNKLLHNNLRYLDSMINFDSETTVIKHFLNALDQTNKSHSNDTETIENDNNIFVRP